MFSEAAKYKAFFQNAFKEVFAYRIRSIIWTIFPLIYFFVAVFLWKAIFESNKGDIYNISLEMYLSYIAISFIIGSLTHCNVDFFIATEVKNGNVAMSLAKPISYQKMIFARHLGKNAGSIVLSLPVFILMLILTKTGFASVGIMAAFLVSVVLSFFLMFFFSYLLGLLAFWLTNTWGVHFLKVFMGMVFSGELIAIHIYFNIGEKGIKYLPFSFLSAGFIQQLFLILGWLCYMLPFQAMIYTPSAIYSGIIKGHSSILFHLLLQVFWLFALYWLCKITWKRVKTKIAILGG